MLVIWSELVSFVCSFVLTSNVITDIHLQFIQKHVAVSEIVIWY